MTYTNRLRYCAPELLADPAQPLVHQPPVAVSGAADIWAVGVIAFELLTNERVFASDTTDAEIVAALRGNALPWEAGVPGQEERCSKLRGLRRAVLACLSRDVYSRPNATALLSSWEYMFDSMKTSGTFDSTRTTPQGPSPAPTSAVQRLPEH